MSVCQVDSGRHDRLHAVRICSLELLASLSVTHSVSKVVSRPHAHPAWLGQHFRSLKEFSMDNAIAGMARPQEVHHHAKKKQSSIWTFAETTTYAQTAATRTIKAPGLKQCALQVAKNSSKLKRHTECR